MYEVRFTKNEIRLKQISKQMNTEYRMQNSELGKNI